MRAAIRTRYGPPEVVSIAEVDEPAVTDGELLIKVHATTVNRTDCALRAAKPFFWRLAVGLFRPKVRVLGNEFAGEVAAVGGGVTAFRTGDRVFGYNDRTWGAHADYMTIRHDGMLATMPEGLTYEQAAPGTEGAHYALSVIHGARIRGGQDVLVYGATGAIGSAAVQLLKQLGVTVTAVCATKDVELVRGLGADKVVDYTAGDFTRDDRRYDAVIDAVGKSSFGRCKGLLKPRGVFIATDLGPYAQNPFLALLTPLFGGRHVRFPLPRQSQAIAVRLKELMESGAFRPVIDRSYPLDDILEAYRYVETGHKTGSVVITFAHRES
ncbi:NAD(P)-dependent alcohol dehydrogenase [Nonomuraea sp. NPDC050643]|uniref:NAD(P)-dependent alcohol dehydrogenase n=1 Tax=Nonomuraea sp. NPDC050643 TaxID=3155660 RepID=UPI0033E7D912